MTVEYIYDGGLDKQTAMYVRNCMTEHPYAVEIDVSVNHPSNLNDVLTKHVWYRENDPGLEDTRMETVRYACTSKNDSDIKFYFFKTNEDKQLFISEYAEQIIDIDPFKTMVKSFQSPTGRIVEVLYRVCGLLSPKRLSENT